MGMARILSGGKMIAQNAVHGGEQRFAFGRQLSFT
jgi:hypothetical protein